MWQGSSGRDLDKYFTCLVVSVTKESQKCWLKKTNIRPWAHACVLKNKAFAKIGPSHRLSAGDVRGMAVTPCRAGKRERRSVGSCLPADD